MVLPTPRSDRHRLRPTYKFVKKWGMALPLHSEFRTLPMLFYVPPLLPVMAVLEQTR